MGNRNLFGNMQIKCRVTCCKDGIFAKMLINRPSSIFGSVFAMILGNMLPCLVTCLVAYWLGRGCETF